MSHSDSFSLKNICKKYSAYLTYLTYIFQTVQDKCHIRQQSKANTLLDLMNRTYFFINTPKITQPVKSVVDIKKLSLKYSVLSIHYFYTRYHLLSSLGSQTEFQLFGENVHKNRRKICSTNLSLADCWKSKFLANFCFCSILWVHFLKKRRHFIIRVGTMRACINAYTVIRFCLIYNEVKTFCIHYTRTF